MTNTLKSSKNFVGSDSKKATNTYIPYFGSMSGHTVMNFTYLDNRKMATRTGIGLIRVVHANKFPLLFCHFPLGSSAQSHNIRF